MKKSPDQIKKALKCCIIGNCSYECPYIDECEAGLSVCQKDCLEYIEQLESRNIKPLVTSLRLRLWRLFHPLKWRKQKKILAKMDEMHEYTGIKVLPLRRM